MHIKKGDKVQIISGEYKGHVGEVDASNVLLYSEELKKGVRTGIVYENGKKVRKSKKTDEKFD